MSVCLDEYTSVQMNVNIHSINEFWNLGKTVIVKFRNIVRIFGKSPLKNEILQSYMKEDSGITLNLAMDF